MDRSITIVVTARDGVTREFSKGVKVIMKRELYSSFVSLNGVFICDKQIAVSQVCSVKLKVDGVVIFNGIPDKVSVYVQSGIKRLSFVCRSYTALTAQNEPKPGVINDVDLSGLVNGCLKHPQIKVEQGTAMESYIFVKSSSSLWDSIIAYNIKRQGRLPYIYDTNTIMSTTANSKKRSYLGEKLTNEGFEVNTLSMVSSVYMRLGNDEYQYHKDNPLAAMYSINRSRYYEMDYQWLHDADKGLAYKISNSNRLSKVKFFEYCSFNNEQLFDVVSGSGTECEGMFINRVVFTADAKGLRTRIYCYDDDFGQK